jgi:photosystem II stability/assembly factor-like uncharacterized protein
MRKIISSISILLFIWSSGITYAQFNVEQNSGVTTSLNSVSVNQDSYYYNNCAWICGNSGVVLRTINYGVNWVNKSGNGLPSNIDLYNIFCVDTVIDLTAGKSGTNTYVYRTSNGGNNWQQVFSQPGGFMDAIWMKNASTGFIYGDPVGGRWSLWKTTNGGINWDSSGMYLPPASSTEAGWNNALFVRNNNIWFGTNNHRVYHSTNFGTTWTYGVTAEASTTAFWFYYLDSLSGFYGGDSVHKTTDGGASWTTMTCPGTGSFMGFVSGMMAVNGNSFQPMLNWTVRGDDKIYISYYMGNWNTYYTASSGSYLHIGTDYQGLYTYTWAVRSNGGITRITTFWGEVKKISSLMPEKYSLSQNYPNPFNPVTKIKFDVPLDSRLRGNDNMTLKIYDVLGKEIITLVNEHLSPGTYEVEWDGTNYPSGVYFYKLINDSYTETRKMMLIK